MPQRHVIRQGECLSSVAKRYGFFPETIWRDSANADLKARRKDGNVLLAGDVLVIPDKRVRREVGATEVRHRFCKKGTPAALRLQLLGGDGEPRRGIDFRLDIDGRLHSGKTDGEGRIELTIPPDACVGKLWLDPDEHFELRLGVLDPVREESGIRQRLSNLGYLADGTADPATVEASIRVFQGKHGLAVTGRPDEPTRSKLTDVHGS